MRTPDIELRHVEMVMRLKKSPQKIIDSMTPSGADMAHMALGIGSEAGEISLSILLHAAFGSGDLDIENLTEELGDLEFYLEGARQVMRVTRETTLGLGVGTGVGAMANRGTPSPADGLMAVGLGVSCAGGMIQDLVKRAVIYNKPISLDAFVLEMAHMEANLKAFRQLIGVTRNTTLEHNVNKLAAGKAPRYPSGDYSDKDALARADKGGKDA